MPPVAVTKTFTPVTRSAWRAWLSANHSTEKEIWFLYRRKAERRSSDEITYPMAVEEALCFGWIDGTAKVHGDYSARRFTPRRKKSSWSEINKARARRLLEEGRMTDAGRAVLPDDDGLEDDSDNLKRVQGQFQFKAVVSGGMGTIS